MADWITEFIEKSGYWGVALLMFAENVFPPIPSELIMPLAGHAAKTPVEAVTAVVAGAAGSLLGATFWYYIGAWVGSDGLKKWASRHGRWLTLRPSEIDTACKWFNRHGAAAVCVGRLVPTVRTLISVPAGIAAMPIGRFLLYSAIGTVVWTALLAGAGYLLRNDYGRVAQWVDPLTNGVLVLLLIGYLYRVARFRHRTS